MKNLAVFARWHRFSVVLGLSLVGVSGLSACDNEMFSDGTATTSKRVVATLDQAELDDVVGEYAFAAKKADKLRLRREDKRICAQIEMPSGKRSPQRRIYPLDRDHYFYRVIEGSIRFERDGSRRVRSATFGQDGAEMHAMRVDPKDAEGR